MPPSVYMADLTYDTTVISIEYFPIGIGYVTAYAARTFAGEFDFRIFKFPNDLFNALDERPPEVLGLSFFAWNKNLALFAARYYKERRPDGVVVLGGPAIPCDPDRRKCFFVENPQVDLAVLYDGESAFVEFLRRFREEPVPSAWDKPIDGCVYLDRKAGLVRQGRVVSRPSDIDEYCSPYLTGLMDEFFDNEQLTPMIQATRGCPFTCSYCWAGNDYNSKIRHFSTGRVLAELEYIAERRKNSINKLLVFADSNFCMYAEDEIIAEKIAELQKAYGFPSSFTAPLGKNNKERVFRILSKIRNAVAIVSVQSTNPYILANVRRQPFDIDIHRTIVRRFQSLGTPVETEIITGLPGETRETHLQTIRDMIDVGINEIHPFTLMFLEGSELDLPLSQELNQWDRRYRVLPRNFGKYRGTILFEVETVGVGSATFSFDDYLYLRGFHVVLRIVFNNAFYVEFTNYLKQRGADLYDFSQFFYRALSEDQSITGAKFREFIRETREEVWESREALIDYFLRDENYARLLSGERGENLLGKFKTLTICDGFDEWCRFYHEQILRYLEPDAAQPDTAMELADIRDHILAKADKVISYENLRGNGIEIDLSHDIPRWVQDSFNQPLAEYRLPKPAHFRYTISDEVRPIVDELLTLNTTHSALWKAVSSRYYLPTFFRKGVLAGSGEGVVEVRAI